MAKKKPVADKTVETIVHEDDKRRNIPTAEFQAVMKQDEQSPVRVAYERRNRDLDPQLVWRGKDEQDWSDLVVHAPPLYIQEKVHPKVLIDDLLKQSAAEKDETDKTAGKKHQLDLFGDFNGIPKGADKTDFYQHDQNWSNRMILGDSLQVMASLAEREGLRGKVQCIYFDPPYGIKFNSNFQWSTTSRDVKDGNVGHITREPEQVKAFRDTWRDGIHSYLTYLRDRLTVARDLLTESGSIFVQIGDENVQRVRNLMDEVFADNNFVSQIHYTTTSGFTTSELSRAGDYVLWYAKDKKSIKYRQIFTEKPDPFSDGKSKYDQIEDEYFQRKSISQLIKREMQAVPNGSKVFRFDNITSQDSPPEPTPINFEGRRLEPPRGRHWTANYPQGMDRLAKANRLCNAGAGIAYVRFFEDFNVRPIHNIWWDIGGTVQRADSEFVGIRSQSLA